MTVVSALRWAVKDSLLGYIRALADGDISATHPATWDGAQFVFPANPELSAFDPKSLSGEIHFSGQVLLSGHWGAMRIELARPEVHLVDGVGQLRLGQLGLFGQRPSFTVANLRSQAPATPWIFEATLSAEGRGLLGEQYEVGQLLSPVTLETAA